MDKQAIAELEKMKNGKVTFIHLSVDPEKETIDFEKASLTQLSEVYLNQISVRVLHH